MKTERLFIRFTALLILLLISNVIAFSQGTDSRMKYAKEGKLYAGILVTPQITGIMNNVYSSFAPLSQKKGVSLNIAFEGGYFFSKSAGISIGLGIGSYSTELLLDSCSIKFQATDSENETFEMRINGKSISERQKLSFLSIPVCFVYKISSGEKLGFYVKAGLSFQIPVVKSYNGNGIFTYDGYYAAYPVLLQNLPAYGFPKNLKTSSSGNLEVKSFNQSLVASAGATFMMNESIQLTMGLYFNRSLGNISEYSTNLNYKLTSKPNELNSIMGGTSGAGFQGVGVSLGLRYFIR